MMIDQWIWGDAVFIQTQLERSPQRFLQLTQSMFIPSVGRVREAHGEKGYPLVSGYVNSLLLKMAIYS